MFHVFGSVRSLLKIDSVCVDNDIFRLHYKATVIILMGFSLIVTSTQYIGNPIDCIAGGIPSSMMNTYCWIYSTFTVPNRLAGKVGRDVVQPGVAGHVVGVDGVQYHRYYQWVCFVLFFQAILFYVPRYVWKRCEAGRLKMLAVDLMCPIIDDRIKNHRIGLLLTYFQTNLHHHQLYVQRFILCEMFNFLNVVAQIYLVDYFFEGQFRTYGFDVLKYSMRTTTTPNAANDDPMAKLFPKVTKCIFRKYGSSGSIQQFDGLCILPLNNVNEKIYAFLWFWFLFLTILTGFGLLYRALIVASKPFRFNLLASRSRLACRKHVRIIVNKFHLGDWFVFYQLGKNIDPFIYKDLIALLATKLDADATDNHV